MNISGNASFVTVKGHVAFARNPGSLQSKDGNGNSAKIDSNSISNNVTAVILFAVLCEALWASCMIKSAIQMVLIIIIK